MSYCVYLPMITRQYLIFISFSGLGETYISLARSSLYQDFHDRAIGYIQNAIIVLARYIDYVRFLWIYTVSYFLDWYLDLNVCFY